MEDIRNAICNLPKQEGQRWILNQAANVTLKHNFPVLVVHNRHAIREETCYEHRAILREMGSPPRICSRKVN